MTFTVDYKSFQEKFNKYCPDNPLTEEQAAEAFHNLAGFINLLIEINRETKVVPIKSQKSKG